MGVVNIISLFGGIAFFLFGMTTMGNGLKKVAGAKMESTLWRLSSTPVKGFALGILTAAVIQSSSATSVMVVSFVNAGMMTLLQAVPVVLGSNIGTTMTGWILTLSSRSGDGVISQLFSAAVLVAVFAVIGILMQMAGKKNATRQIGQIFLGLGVLLLSMSLISDAVAPLKTSESFRQVLLIFDNPALGVLAGLVVAAVVQSASAAVGIVQAISVTGAIDYSAAFFIILGINIGAATPVLISMIGSSRDGKRTSACYLLSNVFSGIIAGLIFIPLRVFAPALMTSPANVLGIAILNTAIRVSTVPIVLLLRKPLIALSYRILPKKAAESADTEEIESLKDSLLNYPPAALERSRVAARKMAQMAYENVICAVSLIDAFDKETFQFVQNREGVIDKYEDKIGNFVIKIGKNALDPKQQAVVSELLSSVGDFERLSDHAVNLSETGLELQEKKLSFSAPARAEIASLVQATKEILDFALTAFCEDRAELAQEIEPLEEVIDEMCKVMRVHHIERLQAGECTILTGFVFSDLLNNLERVSDHCSNIAFCVSHRNNLNEEEHAFAENIATSEEFRRRFEAYRAKYLTPIE